MSSPTSVWSDISDHRELEPATYSTWYKLPLVSHGLCVQGLAWDLRLPTVSTLFAPPLGKACKRQYRLHISQLCQIRNLDGCGELHAYWRPVCCRCYNFSDGLMPFQVRTPSCPSYFGPHPSSHQVSGFCVCFAADLGCVSVSAHPGHGRQHGPHCARPHPPGQRHPQQQLQHHWVWLCARTRLLCSQHRPRLQPRGRASGPAQHLGLELTRHLCRGESNLAECNSRLACRGSAAWSQSSPADLGPSLYSLPT